MKGLRNPMIKEVAVLISLVEAFPRDVNILMHIIYLLKGDRKYNISPNYLTIELLLHRTFPRNSVHKVYRLGYP